MCRPLLSLCRCQSGGCSEVDCLLLAAPRLTLLPISMHYTLCAHAFCVVDRSPSPLTTIVCLLSLHCRIHTVLIPKPQAEAILIHKHWGISQLHCNRLYRPHPGALCGEFGVPDKRIPFSVLNGWAKDTIPKFAKEANAAAVVCDMSPLRVPAGWVGDVSDVPLCTLSDWGRWQVAGSLDKINIPLIQVDAHNGASLMCSAHV